MYKNIILAKTIKCINIQHVHNYEENNGFPENIFVYIWFIVNQWNYNSLYNINTYTFI